MVTAVAATSKERTTAHSSQKLKQSFRKNCLVKKLPSDTASGMVTIIWVRLKSKSLLRKEIYGGFEKSLKPTRK